MGFCAVLLLVGLPVRTCAVPLVATLLNAKLKVRRAALLPVLEIYPTQLSAKMINVFRKMMTLMISWPVDVLRTTLQKTVPVLEGKVLGIYWSPRFRLKSF